MSKIGLACFIILCLAFSVFSVGSVYFVQTVEAAETANIGEWTSDGRIAIFIHSFDTASSVPYYPYSPASGNVYVWVDVSLKNVGTGTISTNTLYAYVADIDHYYYRGEVVSSPRHLALIDLPPQETIRGEIYFEVPADSVIEKFVWQDNYSNLRITVPELPSFLILPLFMIATLLAVIVCRRKQNRQATLYFS